MCLAYNEFASKYFSKYFWRDKSPGQTKDYFFKLYYVFNKEMISPYWECCVFHGEIISNRESIDFTKSEKRHSEIYKGIHVCYSSEEIETWKYDARSQDPFDQGTLVVVKVSAKKEDFVGCDGQGNAVFTKVHLSRAEYRKAMKLAKTVLVESCV